MGLFGNKSGLSSETKQLQNEIKSLEFRKQTILSSFDAEIVELDKKKNQEFLAAGTKAYEIAKLGENCEEALTEYWNRVDELNVKIEEKETKKKEMETKYDEELVLLQASLGGGSWAACPKCGSQVSTGDMFCEKCGNKLK